MCIHTNISLQRSNTKFKWINLGNLPSVLTDRNALPMWLDGSSRPHKGYRLLYFCREGKRQGWTRGPVVLRSFPGQGDQPSQFTWGWEIFQDVRLSALNWWSPRQTGTSWPPISCLTGEEWLVLTQVHRAASSDSLCGMPSLERLFTKLLLTPGSPG